MITKDKGVGGVTARLNVIIAANTRQAIKHVMTTIMLNHAIFCRLFINLALSLTFLYFVFVFFTNKFRLKCKVSFTFCQVCFTYFCCFFSFTLCSSAAVFRKTITDNRLCRTDSLNRYVKIISNRALVVQMAVYYQTDRNVAAYMKIAVFAATKIIKMQTKLSKITDYNIENSFFVVFVPPFTWIKEMA